MMIRSFVSSFLVLASSLQANDFFPFQKDLEHEVKFWELALSRYNADECMFHDSNDLRVIYGIKKIKRGSSRAENLQIERQQTKIRRALMRLASGSAVKTPTETQVYTAIPKELRQREYYRSAIDSVRCQRGIRDNFAHSLKRSARHLPVIRQVLKRQGLPTDLAYLPHLESGFHARAHSRVGARGLWQLMPGVAREMGLRVSSRRDDRLDPQLATRAAVKILKTNFQKAGSWPLALTGYNYGINGIARGLDRLGPVNFVQFRQQHESPIFGFAAKSFYPSFLAVRNLAKLYEKKVAKKPKDLT